MYHIPINKKTPPLTVTVTIPGILPVSNLCYLLYFLLLRVTHADGLLIYNDRPSASGLYPTIQTIKQQAAKTQ